LLLSWFSQNEDSFNPFTELILNLLNWTITADSFWICLVAQINVFGFMCFLAQLGVSLCKPHPFDTLLCSFRLDSRIRKKWVWGKETVVKVISSFKYNCFQNLMQSVQLCPIPKMASSLLFLIYTSKIKMPFLRSNMNALIFLF